MSDGLIAIYRELDSRLDVAKALSNKAVTFNSGRLSSSVTRGTGGVAHLPGGRRPRPGIVRAQHTRTNLFC